MQEEIDSRVLAQVRILLARRWVDLRAVTVGTTNGVVYIGGELRANGGADPAGSGAWGDRGRIWMQRLRREIAEIPEVRDVVFQFDHNDRGEEAWGRKSA